MSDGSRPNGDQDARAPQASGSTLPTWLICLGVVVGLLLLILGLAFELFAPTSGDPQNSQMILCVGLGVVLAMLGTTAQVERRTWSMAGGGAISIILFVILNHYRSTEARQQLVAAPPVAETPCSENLTRGSLKPEAGQFHERTSILLKDRGQPLYGVMDEDRSAFRFIAFGDHFQENEVHLNIDEASENADKGTRLYLFRLPAEKLNDYLKHRSAINLIYNRKHSQIIDQSTNATIASLLSASDDIAWSFQPPSLFSEAQAAETPQASSPRELVRRLNDPDSQIRISARDDLVTLKGEAVEPLTEALKEATAKGDADRRFNILNTLLEVLRASPGVRAEIASRLSEQDFMPIVDMLGEDDRSARVLATLFLTELRDTDAVESLKKGLRFGTDNGRYNTAYVLESLLGDLGDNERDHLIAFVHSRAGRESQDRNKQAFATFGARRFHIIVASFSDQGAAIDRARKLQVDWNYADAQAYRLTNGLYVATIGQVALSDVQQVIGLAIEKGAASNDAWATSGTMLAKQVFP